MNIDLLKIKIDNIKDCQGTPVDYEIKNTILAFMILGFNLSGSCSRHKDHGLSYPWVDFDYFNDFVIPPDSEKYNKSQRDKFENMLKKYNVQLKSDYWIEEFGFGGFRFCANNINLMNELANKIIKGYNDTNKI